MRVVIPLELLPSPPPHPYSVPAAGPPRTDAASSLVAPLSTPRIDSLLASRHARQRHPPTTDTELLAALHVESRLEAVETHLAALSASSAGRGPGIAQVPSPGKRPTRKPLRRPSSTAATLAVQTGELSVPERLRQLEAERDAVSQQLDRHRAVRRDQNSGRSSKPSEQHVEPAEKESTSPELSASARATTTREEPSSQPAVLHLVRDPAAVLIEERLTAAQSALQTEREEWTRERADMRRQHDEAVERGRKLQAQLDALTAEAEESGRALDQQKRAVAEAGRRERDLRDQITQLWDERRQSVEMIKDLETAMSRTRAEEERRWTERVRGLERQVADASAEERRARAEGGRLEDECDQLRRSLATTQQQLGQWQEAAHRLQTQLDYASQELLRLQKADLAHEEQRRREREEHEGRVRQLEREREKEGAAWREERQQLLRLREEVEARLSSLQTHFLQRQQDASDLKELLKLSVRRERDAATAAELLKCDVEEAQKAVRDSNQRWQHGVRDWEMQRAQLQEEHRSVLDTQRAAAEDATAKWRQSAAEAQSLTQDNLRLERDVEELKKSTRRQCSGALLLCAVLSPHGPHSPVARSCGSLQTAQPPRRPRADGERSRRCAAAAEGGRGPG